MSNHITTRQTFFHDAPSFEGECIVCKRTSILEFGWVGVRCSVCDTVFSGDGGTSEVVRLRRKVMGLNRRQMADVTGYSSSSIKNYEFGYCTRPYYDATERVILNFHIQK